MKPVRIQRKRTKGWRMPENTVCVTRPGRWGNPVEVGMVFADATINTKRDAAAYFAKCVRSWIRNETYPDPSELRGKNLACFCKLGEPCHADVLLKLANPDRE